MSPTKFVLSVSLIMILVGLSALTARAQTTPVPGATHVPVVFAGGHDTDGRDRGRPVVLIAAALDVTPDVFREAFSHVHPAGPGSGGPTDAEARANKKALMDALGKYGVTDERLNDVSNYYRYVRSRGEIWPTKPAAAYAVVEKGAVTGYVVTDGGSGYSSVPTISVPGFRNPPKLYVPIGHSETLEKNGTILSITTYPLK